MGAGPGSRLSLHTARWRMATALSPPRSVSRAKPASRRLPSPKPRCGARAENHPLCLTAARF